jgi:protein-S-isoprenylcysteine O-methyltransferase Ste14
MCFTRQYHDNSLINLHSDFDAAFVGVVGALASAVVLLVSTCLSMRPSTAVLAGCCAVIVGSATYFSHRRTNTDEAVQSTSKVRP